MPLHDETPRSASTRLDRRSLSIVLVLVLLTALAYAQVGSFGFVHDDPLYLSQNSRTLAGLNGQSLRWAFTCFEDGSYLPLVWLSHAACVSLFGSDPAGHHLVNLALHLANTALLFLLLRRLTGAVGPSAVVAVIFGLHPTHVESVAWVAERKDLLSTLFWLLGIWAYAAYVRQPSWRRYLGVAILFILGLLSKSMVVTFPLTLLILDVWPLGRLGDPAQLRADWPARLRRLVAEKLPMIAGSVAIGLLTIWAQRQSGAVPATGSLSFLVRAANAALAVLKYLQLLVWPADMSPFYPHPGARFSRPLLGLALAAIAAITVLSVVLWRRRPYLLAGWAWFLVTVAPVLGFLQVGAQAYADRYTYVPQIGLSIMLAWAGKEWLDRVRLPRPVLLAVSGGLVGILLTLTLVQASRWRDGKTLFAHAVSLDPANEFALGNLGVVLSTQGQLAEAAGALTRAIAINPAYHMFHYNLGGVLERMGRIPEAIGCFRAAARLEPASVLGDYRLAHLLVSQGRSGEALPHLDRVFRSPRWQISPDPGIQSAVLQVSLVDLGIILREQQRLAESVAKIQESVAMNPRYSWARLQLGLTLLASGQEQEAVEQLRMAGTLEANRPQFRYHLGRGLLLIGRPKEARAAFMELLAQDPASELGRRGMQELSRATEGARK